MRIRFNWNIKIAESGYLHIPLLYITIGHDGFVLALPTFNILISWGDAVKKQKQEEKTKQCNCLKEGKQKANEKCCCGTTRPPVVPKPQKLH